MSLLKNMDEIVRCFRKYASEDSDKGTISKKELNELLKNELGAFGMGEEEMQAAKEHMTDMDLDGDDTLDFMEFVMATAAFILFIHQKFGGQLTSEQVAKK